MPDIIVNRKARFDYEILEKFDAGIELLGHEVKALKKKHGSLEGAYISIRKDEVYLLGANIPPYQPANTPKDYNPTRDRRLLLTKKEISKLSDLEKQKGLTIIPVSVYTKQRNLKLKLAVARGKKRYDKRETIKKRETDREIRRTLKRKY